MSNLARISHGLYGETPFFWVVVIPEANIAIGPHFLNGRFRENGGQMALIEINPCDALVELKDSAERLGQTIDFRPAAQPAPSSKTCGGSDAQGEKGAPRAKAQFSFRC
jgi:hypothetical protein